jgi:hypothetical protein
MAYAFPAAAIPLSSGVRATHGRDSRDFRLAREPRADTAVSSQTLQQILIGAPRSLMMIITRGVGKCQRH